MSEHRQKEDRSINVSNTIRLIVCGGQGPQEDIPEAITMKRYLEQRGIPADRIIVEDRSTSTFENLTFAREILKKQIGDEFTSVLITNDFHVYRATRIARSAGVESTHIGASMKWYTIPSTYVREILAVMRMWVFPQIER
ncbi:MAG: YdcF family protein [Coriobacteriia bacterium]|nr:YdcF family protein [Coriobacteriia bacterium]